MSTNFRLLPYKLGSQGGRELINGLGGLTIHPTRGSYRRRDAHRIINWGNSNKSFDAIFTERDFNHPAAVGLGIDKLSSFTRWVVEGVNHPEWTTDRDRAAGWLRSDNILLGRSSATGSCGKGITVYRKGDNLDRSELFYSRVVGAVREYRVHIGFRPGLVGRDIRVGGRRVLDECVIDVVQKKKRRGIDADTLIRSHDNGWVFCRNDIVPPGDHVLHQAVMAVHTLGLDFGACDIGVSKENIAVVFEVNTAPGIEGLTLARYQDYFNRAIA